MSLFSPATSRSNERSPLTTVLCRQLPNLLSGWQRDYQRIHEPRWLHLRVPTDTTLAAAQWSLDAYHFLLRQVPGVEQIVWDGPGNPLALPQFHEALSLAPCPQRLRLPAMELTPWFQTLHQLPVHDIRIALYAHRPAMARLQAGLEPEAFPSIETSIRRFMAYRRHQAPAGETGAVAPITLQLLLNRHSMAYLEEMVEYAENLGVDAVQFLNIPPHQYAEHPDAHWEMLYCDQPMAVQRLQQFQHQHYRVRVELPHLPAPPNETGRLAERKRCGHPFYTPSVSLANWTVGACPAGIPLRQPQTGKPWVVWEGDFWNNPAAVAARKQVCSPNAAEIGSEEPLPCTTCPWYQADER